MEIKGLITAMITPFDEAGNLYEPGTKQLIEKLIHEGVDGIFILGTNGEFHVLEEAEKVAFAKMVVRIVDHRVPVYAGAGACGTKQCITLAKQLEAIGVDALSVITPYLQPLSDQELIDHYTQIANAVSCPILLYNIPKNTGNCISANCVKVLSKIKNIRGIKDSSGQLDLMKSYLDASKKEDFVVLSGSDSLILKSLQIGASGAIAATSNLLTAIDVSIYQHYLHKEFDKAQAAQASIDTLRNTLKLGVQPSIIKKALVLSGIPVGLARSPIAAPNADDEEKVREMLHQYHLPVVL